MGADARVEFNSLWYHEWIVFFIDWRHQGMQTVTYFGSQSQQDWGWRLQSSGESAVSSCYIQSSAFAHTQDVPLWNWGWWDMCPCGVITASIKTSAGFRHQSQYPNNFRSRWNCDGVAILRQSPWSGLRIRICRPDDNTRRCQQKYQSFLFE